MNANPKVDDDILSEELVCSDEEILDEFWHQCQTTRIGAGPVPEPLASATKALGRMLNHTAKIKTADS
jgi:hypothetical protein